MIRSDLPRLRRRLDTGTWATRKPLKIKGLILVRNSTISLIFTPSKLVYGAARVGLRDRPFDRRTFYTKNRGVLYTKLCKYVEDCSYNVARAFSASIIV